MPVTRAKKQAMEPAASRINTRLRTGSISSRITAKAESTGGNRDSIKNDGPQCITGLRPGTSKNILMGSSLKKINNKCTNNDNINNKDNNGTDEKIDSTNNCSQNSGQSQYKCMNCDKIYMSASGLGRHRRGGCVPRTACGFCGLSFASFAGVRLHEKSAHPKEYNKDLEDKLKPPDSYLLEQLAEIEVSSKNGYFYKTMIEKTGLTHQQIKYRRGMPIYKEYLRRANDVFKSNTKKVNSPSTSKNEIQKPATITSNKERTVNPCTVSKQAGPLTAISNNEETYNLRGMPKRGRPAGVVVPPDRTVNDNEIEIDDDIDDDYNVTSKSPPVNDGVTVIPAYDNNKNNDKITNKSELSTSLQNNKRNTKRISISLPNLNEDQDNDPFITFLTECRELLIKDRYLTEIIDIVIDRSDAEIIPLMERWLGEIFGRKAEKSRKQSKKAEQRPYGQKSGGRGPRAALYKKAQDLYNKNRAALADIVISGRDLRACDGFPDIDDVERLYAEIYEVDNIRTDLENKISKDKSKIRIRANKNEIEIFRPVTPEEVKESKIKWGNSAPGPDGVTHASVKKCDDIKLAVLFTIVIYKNLKIPSWQRARTTLIYKNGDRKDPGNWRPITVSSMVQRLLHRILSKRIKSCVELNKNQRGFVEGDGTLANMLILHHFIKNKRASRKPYNVVSLDVKKAFDTVSHGAIRGALVRQNIDQRIIEYIVSNLKTSTTEISVGGKKTRTINIRRGVKQGDPLSPLLFNLVIDELLNEIDNNRGGGTLIEGTKCKVLAFADDLVLMEDDNVNVPQVLEIVDKFMDLRGMEINPRKCCAVSIETINQRLVTRTKPQYKIKNTWIPQSDNINTYKYLGHEFNATGICKPNICNLSKWLENISKAAIKPDQKVEIVRDFVIPKLQYGLQSPAITSAILRDADRLIRRYIKKFLHFHIHTSDAVIHGKIKDGGLGIIDLRGNIPRILLGRITKLIEKCDGDVTLSAVLQHEDMTNLLYRLDKLCGNIPSEQLWKNKIASQPTTKGLESSAEDIASRSWVSKKPKGWTGKDYVKATQLRTANLPTAAIPTNPPELRMCRGGCQTQETLNHVLQKCPVTHYERIYRHNEIAKKIAKHCRDKGWTIEEEPHVRHADGQLYKPDIAIHKNNKIVICDIQVSWEGNRPFEAIWKEKEIVYNNKKFIEASKGRWPNKKFEFLPVIVGARGIWPRCNEKTENELEMTDGLKSSCVHSALKWGPSIHNAFMRGVWKRWNGRERNVVNERNQRGGN